jgi:hypothetical protein
LNPDRRATSPKHEARLHSGHNARLLECTQCGALRVAGEKCRHCGFLPQRPLAFHDGDLALVDRQKRTATSRFGPAERARWHGMLAFIAHERGYNPKFARIKYREKFGDWPPWGAAPIPIPASPEVRSWVRSRMIAYAKAKKKENAA